MEKSREVLSVVRRRRTYLQWKKGSRGISSASQCVTMENSIKQIKLQWHVSNERLGSATEPGDTQKSAARLVARHI